MTGDGRDDGEQQAEGAHRMTTKERSVLALEHIADELTLLNQSIDYILDRDDARTSREDQGAMKGHPTEDEADAVGDEAEYDPSAAESFSVGGYRYANLQHSIRQARRARGDAASPVTRDD